VTGEKSPEWGSRRYWPRPPSELDLSAASRLEIRNRASQFPEEVKVMEENTSVKAEPAAPADVEDAELLEQYGVLVSAEYYNRS